MTFEPIQLHEAFFLTQTVHKVININYLQFNDLAMLVIYTHAVKGADEYRQMSKDSFRDISLTFCCS